MKSFTYTVTDELGLHARPASQLVKESKKYKSTITVSDGVKKTTAAQLMMLMSMGIKKGATVTVSIEGEDEEIAYVAIQQFFKDNL
ncbi:MAG: HPr family phosphocarrier protein [Lachnospiraceae bacterium]|jgi:phosphocarrier protein|nr:HPr family phosphocarrier protein [Lachnospiraceae bacterium]